MVFKLWLKNRSFKEMITITPSPVTYQKNWMKRKTIKPSYKPFETSAERFQEPTVDPMLTPG